MSYTVYKIIHLLGIFTLFVALAGLSARTAWGGGGRHAAAEPGGRRLLMALHGTGLLLVLLGGFGMMARLGISHTAIFPGWIWVKLAIWLLAGGLVVPARRPRWAVAVLVLLPLLGALAGTVALYKPFS